MGERGQGWRSGGSTRLPPGPGSNPGVAAICWLFPFYFRRLGFSPLPNSSSTRNQVDQEPLRGCATSKSLFMYSFKFCNSVHSKFIRRFSFLSVLAYNLWGEGGVKFCVTNVPIHFLYEVFTS